MTKAPMVKGISLEIPVLAFQVRVLVGAPMNKCVSKGAVSFAFLFGFWAKISTEEVPGPESASQFPSAGVYDII